jgi:hypothetical protein
LGGGNAAGTLDQIFPTSFSTVFQGSTVMGANHAGEQKRKKAKITRKNAETKARKAAQTAAAK